MLTVLIVDDDPLIVELLVDIISDAGYATLRAKNGQEGLLLAQQQKPALVMSDIRMPIMDGYTLLNELRADPVSSDTPVILMSARFDSPQLADEHTIFLAKPFDVEQLEGILQRLL